MRAVTAVLVALSLASVAAAQPPPPPAPPGSPTAPRDAARTGTAALAGRVVSLENGRPLRRAVVRVMSPELREGRSVSSDADGRWEIKELPAGRYSINVQKGGYVPLAFGQRRPFEQGKPVDLADGQRVEKLEIQLPKGSVLSGRIVDEFGEPIAGARVAAMRHRFMNGQRRLMPVASPGGSDTTDDIGQYRLHGLSPGDYYLSASLAGLALEVSADRTGYAATYYPGTPVVAEAQRVTLAVGQEVPEVSFPMTPTRVAKISGTAMTSAGKPMGSGMVMLTSASGVGISGSPISGAGMTRPDGTFTISNVTPGEYRLEMVATSALESLAQSGGGIGTVAVPEAASMPITVTGQDVSGIVLTSAATATATGRVAFEGTPPAESAIAGLIVMGVPESMTGLPLGGSAKVRGDGRFEMKGLTGRRFLRAVPPPGWFLKSVRVNDTDVTDTAVEFKPGEEVSGVEFLLTQRSSTVSGRVQDSKGQPVADYVVVAFASDSRKWGTQTRFIRSARPDQSGNFKLSALPPEDYLLVAVEYLESGEEGDPELLERLRPSGTAVTVADGGSKNVTLKLSR